MVRYRVFVDKGGHNPECVAELPPDQLTFTWCAGEANLGTYPIHICADTGISGI